MKKVLLSILTLILSAAGFAATITISTPGFEFSPANPTINFGDTIVFDVGSIHTATEVASSTWSSNQPTPVTGFNFGPGSHELTGLSVGTHYFVCQNHVSSMFMKGTITVQAVSGIKTKTGESDLFKIFPNPAKDNIYFDVKDLDVKKITITDIEGKIVKEISLGKNSNKISILDLADGEYLFSVYTKKEEIFIKKFVKKN
ncbi:MAG: hypothetical protein JWN78_1445 [Bacteroidota bacterium]|nr:hypothetical protein [Bacteroidota bacterium]